MTDSSQLYFGPVPVSGMQTLSPLTPTSPLSHLSFSQKSSQHPKRSTMFENVFLLLFETRFCYFLTEGRAAGREDCGYVIIPACCSPGNIPLCSDQQTELWFFNKHKEDCKNNHIPFKYENKIRNNKKKSVVWTGRFFIELYFLRPTRKGWNDVSFLVTELYTIPQVVVSVSCVSLVFWSWWFIKKKLLDSASRTQLSVLC